MSCTAALPMCLHPAGKRTPRDPEKDVLRQVLREHLSTFLDSIEGSALPQHVQKEVQAYLSCGSFEQGAACFVCDSCGQRTFLPFSCKTRSFCPSCCGRRMCDIAAHVVDRVLPDIAYRQWVLSLPIPVRFLVLRHRKLVGKILAVFLRAVFGHLRSKAKKLGIRDAHLGSLSAEQRFGDGARLHWHVHTIIPDGVFHRPVPDGPAVFVRVPAPHRDELAQIVVRIRVRVLRLLRRAGLDPDQLDEQDIQGDLLAGWQAASLQGRIAVGPHKGWRVIRIGAQNVAVPPMGQGLCADAEGYNLHAGVHVPAGQRDRLEHLLRYMLRPPFARDRLERLGDGRVLVRLKRPYSDGTRALVFAPLDFIARLCALVAPPRVHLVHYSGIFAPHSSFRSAVVPEPPSEPQPQESPAQLELPSPTKAGQGKKRADRHLWSELMKRTFGLDMLACGCGGRLRLLCFIFDPVALAAIKQSQGGGRAPPKGPREGPEAQLRLPGLE